MNTGLPDEPEDDGSVVAFPGSRSRLAQIEAVFRDNEKRLLQFLRIRLHSESEAQDAAQSAFLRLWQRHDLLRNENLVSLLFVTARNIAIDMLRQRARICGMTSRPDGEQGDARNVRDQSAGPDRILSAKQDLSLIIKLIDELPAKCRAAFVSYQFHHLSYLEIADRMGVTESMVRKYVVRAVAHCAARFEQLEGWE